MLSPNQARIQSFRVVPSLPEALTPLLEIAHNLWWSWDHEAIDLFVRLDRELWERTNHNPVKLLGTIAQEKLDRAAADRSYLHALSSAHAKLKEHLAQRAWFDDKATGDITPGKAPFRVAYFCAEFGLTEGFQIYSGGLGGLSGDHLKSASELGIPLVAIGLLYRKGYFHQYLNPDGWQQETYPELDAPNQPVQRVSTKDGKELKIAVEFPGRTVTCAVWRCNVGRIPLYLLDTNLPENSREDRDITCNLYGGDHEMRIKQEIVLGIGGVRTLRAVGENPTVCHINEGHAAFISLERIAEVRRKNPTLTFDQAREAIASSQVFTTHTPVPAGIDRFPAHLVETYLQPMLGAIGLDTEGLLALGRENTADRKESFSMAVLAIRTSRFANGVSELHGHVSRAMWKHMWPGTPHDEVPIGHVTNGVHPRTWIGKEFVRLYDRYLGGAWRSEPQNHKVWEPVLQIPDEELWNAHCKRREKLIAWCRTRIRQQLASRGAGTIEIDRAASALDVDTLTIGFARRFATYKRGTLLFRDIERLKRILLSVDKPVQVIVAGKSHPADGGGKALIRDIVQFCRTSGCGHRVVFIEDYDMQIARRMVQGCDIWLNTPLRGLEASGTSGMKAAMNGCIHCSILDGWWDEGFHPETGFAIGRGESYDEAPREEQDDIESRSLYQVLESQVIPEFYDRDGAGVPRRWILRMKRCIRDQSPRFNTHRMVVDYTKKFYIPAHNAQIRLAADGFREARELADHVDRYRHCWSKVRVLDAQAVVQASESVAVRSIVKVSAQVELGELVPQEVMVQLYHGKLTALGEITDATPIVMQHAGPGPDGTHKYTGVFAPSQSGQHGFSVRVLPNDDRLVTPFVPGLITWDTGMIEPEPAPTPVESK